MYYGLFCEDCKSLTPWLTDDPSGNELLHPSYEEGCDCDGAIDRHNRCVDDIRDWLEAHTGHSYKLVGPDFVKELILARSDEWLKYEHAYEKVTLSNGVTVRQTSGPVDNESIRKFVKESEDSHEIDWD